MRNFLCFSYDKKVKPMRNFILIINIYTMMMMIMMMMIAISVLCLLLPKTILIEGYQPVLRRADELNTQHLSPSMNFRSPSLAPIKTGSLTISPVSTAPVKSSPLSVAPTKSPTTNGPVIATISPTTTVPVAAPTNYPNSKVPTISPVTTFKPVSTAPIKNSPVSVSPTVLPSTLGPTKSPISYVPTTKAPAGQPSVTTTGAPAVVTTNFDVIIIGAGIAGLTAAKQLIASNKKVIILEARNRTGGRMYTDYSGTNFSVEMGAGWVQNYDTRYNPTIALYQNLGLKDISFDWNNAKYYNFDGTTDNQNDDATDKSILATVTSKQSGYSLSVDMYTAINAITPWSSLSDYDKAELYAGVEEEYGAPLELLSAKYWNTEGKPGYSDTERIMSQGYSALINKMAAGLNIRRNKVVRSVDYTSSSTVQVSATDGTVYTAPKVLITVPLGVLKKGSITFNPPLPSTKTGAISKLGMGVLNHVCLQFPRGTLTRNGVGTIEYMQKNPSTKIQSSYNGRGFVEIITYYHTKRLDVICGEAPANFGSSIESLDDASIVNLLMYELKECLPNLPNPIAQKISRWNQDPYSYGSYSYIPINAANTDRQTLAAPVNQQLYFAGEATCVNYPALVQGGYSSGLREACNILGGTNCASC